MAYGLFSDVGAMVRGIWDPGYYSGEYMQRKSEYQLAKKTLRKRERSKRIRTRERGRVKRTEATGKRAIGSATPAIGLGLIGGAGIAAAAGLRGPWGQIARSAGGLTADQYRRMQAGEPPTSADYGKLDPTLLIGGAILLAGGVWLITTSK